MIVNWVRYIASVLATWGLAQAFLIASLVVCADCTATWQAFNDLAYDPLVRVRGMWQTTGPRVLLVYADQQTSESPSRVAQFVRDVHRLGGRGVGIVGIDRDWSVSQRAEVAAAGSTVWGIERDSGGPIAEDLPQGTVELLHMVDGIYRWYVGRPKGSLRNTWAAEIAYRLGDIDATIAESSRPHGVQFRGSANSLPHVTWSQLLDDELLPSLVRDRIVLLGPPADAWNPGVATPTTGTGRMSVLEFHGHALQCYLADQRIRPLPVNGLFAVYGFFAWATILLVRRTRFSQLPMRIVQALVIETLGALALLHGLNYTLPGISVLAVQGIAGLWIVGARMRYTDDTWHLMRRRGFQLSPRYRAHPILEAGAGPWPRMAAFLQQLLPVDRVAILVTQPGFERLELVNMTGFGPDAVLERRRDLRRQPFIDAVERRCTVRIDDTRPFFHPALEQYQFLAPLFHAGQVRGAIIVQADQLAIEQLPGFSQQLMLFCEELGSWVARYQEISLQSQRKKHWWTRWQNALEQDTFETLERYLYSLERRLQQTYQVVEQATHGKAVFDLGGQMVSMNAAMFRSMHRLGIGSTDASLLRILETLSRRTTAECRELLRRALVDGREARFVLANGDGLPSLVVVLRPLHASDWIAARTDEMRAFHTHGLHLELVNGDLFEEYHQLREHTSGQALQDVDQILREVRAMSEELRHHRDPRTWRQLTSTVEDARWTIQCCRDLLHEKVEEQTDLCWPLNLAEIVRGAVAEAQSMADRHGATLVPKFCDGLPDASAQPELLRRLVLAAVELLLHHASERSRVEITTKVSGEFILVEVANEQCNVILDRKGVSQREWLEAMPVGLQRLEAMRGRVRQWGGELSIESDMSTGARVSIQLRAFRWRERQRRDSSVGAV